MPTKPRKAGRPPAGDQGQKTSEYPVMSVRVPTDVRAGFVALAQYAGMPLRDVLSAALGATLKGLPKEDQREILRWADRMARSNPKTAPATSSKGLTR